MTSMNQRKYCTPFVHEIGILDTYQSVLFQVKNHFATAKFVGVLSHAVSKYALFYFLFVPFESNILEEKKARMEEKYL